MAQEVPFATQLLRVGDDEILTGRYARSVLEMGRSHAARLNSSLQKDGRDAMTGLFYPAQYATGDLPTASASEGSVAYDSTLRQLVYSNGTSWVAL